MSKYTEAIKEAQFQIANAQVFLESKEYENEPAIQWSAKRKLRDFKIYLEALQIADRVEQADVTKHKKAYYNHDDSEHGDGYCIGFQDGYELALADIRGDNNDNNGDLVESVNDMPTIDIVRCKDCIYFQKGWTKCKMLNLNGADGDWYCASGERKNE